MFCSSVIQPYSKFPDHVKTKHNVANYSQFLLDSEKLYDLFGDEVTGFFNCRMCGKKKRTNLLFGHYIFYHNLSIHALKKCIEKDTNVKIDGSSLNGIDNDMAECSGRDVCNVCEKPILADSNVHEVFCQGLVICSLRECGLMFENKKALARHLDFEHPVRTCKFGCPETKLKVKDIDDHLQKSHDIIECNLCSIINSSGNYKNHLRDKHSVNLMTYEKAMGQTSMKLYRLEGSSRHKKSVLCNFCDYDITKQIQEFSFISHYQNQHEIHITAILRNLDKNPIIDVILKNKKLKIDEGFLKNFQVIAENSVDELIETDFDASKVCCIATDAHTAQAPQIFNDASSLIICDFCKKTTFDASCRLYEHLIDTHGFQLLNVKNRCDTCHFDIRKQNQLTSEDDKSFNLSLVCPIDESFHATKDNFKDHISCQHNELMTDRIIYKCFECNFVYLKIDEIRDHFKTSHPEDHIIYCRICRCKLSNSSENLIHFNLNHADHIKSIEKFRCNLCKKLFTKKNKAKIHYDNYHKKKELNKKAAFKCQFQPFCAEGFQNKEDRKMHHMVSILSNLIRLKSKIL